MPEARKTALGMEEETEPVVEMKGIVKTFPGVVANDHIDFEVRAGEIHALLGENGAGKTTLMNILFGIYQPDEGEIYVRGKRVEIRSPRDAMRLGIGMVHQHFMLVEKHTVAENIALGFATKFILPTRQVIRKIREFSERYGLTVDPNAYIWQLSAGEQQRVEIIKALYRGADILILDEPTSVLTPKETKEFFSILMKMKEEGKAIIFITHKLDEVFAISDRVTVLRKGKVVGRLKTSETNKGELAKLMVGREVLFSIEKRPVKKGRPILEVIDLHAMDDSGLPALKGISIRILSGEILGLAGVAGNGQKELFEVLAGLRKATKGRIVVDGIDVTNSSPRRISELGVAHIPGERLRYGLVPNMSVAENLVLKKYYRNPFKIGFVLNKEQIVNDAKNLMEEYQIIAPSHKTTAKLLSGGNIQRMILARELSARPKLIIAAHPTSGLDVAATEYIRMRLLEERERGAAILLISEDLDELLMMSDRIAVIFEGEIMGEMTAEEADVGRIGLMMAGVRAGVSTTPPYRKGLAGES